MQCGEVAHDHIHGQYVSCSQPLDDFVCFVHVVIIASIIQKVNQNFDSPLARRVILHPLPHAEFVTSEPHQDSFIILI